MNIFFDKRFQKFEGLFKSLLAKELDKHINPKLNLRANPLDIFDALCLKITKRLDSSFCLKCIYTIYLDPCAYIDDLLW